MSDLRIALLRGINVGGHGKLPMADLRALLDALGCTRVATYIQSGNAVFASAEPPGALERSIAAEIERRHGFRPGVRVFDAAVFARIVRTNPFPQAAAAPQTLHAFFLDAPPRAPDLAGLGSLAAPDERFELKRDVFWLLAPGGIGRSKLAAAVERRLGMGGTARNLRTVTHLLDMVQRA